MIPASYMFKDIYHQHWENEETSPQPVDNNQFGGMTTPAWHLMLTLLHRRFKPGRQYFGAHAYH